MRELISATGMVISASPMGDYDKRLVILTKERGKITCFARGAKRAASQLRAPSRPFVFGVFTMSEGRDAYNLYSAEVENYFEELSKDMECACYASYFAEFAGYYGRENVDESETIRLLYQSYRALYGAEVENYFEELSKDMECACYASYFAEFAGYYGRENVDESETIRLLYQSYRALLKPVRLLRLLLR